MARAGPGSTRPPPSGCRLPAVIETLRTAAPSRTSLTGERPSLSQPTDSDFLMNFETPDGPTRRSTTMLPPSSDQASVPPGSLRPPAPLTLERLMGAVEEIAPPESPRDPRREVPSPPAVEERVGSSIPVPRSEAPGTRFDVRNRLSPPHPRSSRYPVAPASSSYPRAEAVRVRVDEATLVVDGRAYRAPAVEMELPLPPTARTERPARAGRAARPPAPPPPSAAATTADQLRQAWRSTGGTDFQPVLLGSGGMQDVYRVPGTPPMVAKVIRPLSLEGRPLDHRTQARLLQRTLLFHDVLRSRGVRVPNIDTRLLSHGILLYEEVPRYSIADLRRMAAERPGDRVRAAAVRRAEAHIRAERARIAPIEDDLIAINEGRYERRFSNREDPNDPSSEVIRGADVGSGADAFLFDVNGSHGVMADW